MSSYQLAQLNIAKMKYEIGAPELSDFVANLERINMLDRTISWIYMAITDGRGRCDQYPRFLVRIFL